MSNRQRSTATQQTTQSTMSNQERACQAPENSVMQNILRSTPVVGGAIDMWNGMDCLGSVINEHESADKGADYAGRAASVAGGFDAFDTINRGAKYGNSTLGYLGSAISFANAASDVNDIEEKGLDAENGFSLLGNTLGVLSPFLPWQAQALIGAGNMGVTAGNGIVEGTEYLAEQHTGPDADRRGLTSRLADRGGAMDKWVDEATGSDTAGDVAGGLGTVGQMLVPGVLHYDILDSVTGGGLSNTVDDGADMLSSGADMVSDKWDSIWD